jgi:biotin operon repressor
VKSKRPKFKKPSLVDRVAEYDNKIPNATADTCAKQLGISKSQVWAARNAICKRGNPVDAVPLNTKDIVTISRIGIVKAEQIIQLLKQLERGNS